MKKLLSIAFVMISMMFVASSADAQSRNNQRNPNNNQTQARNNQDNARTNQRNNQNNGWIVRTYTETKTVRIRGDRFLETYEVQVFRNGATNSKLISRVEIKNGRRNNRHHQKVTNISYQTTTIWENGRKYRVTYKITKFSNGRTTSEIVNKVHI